MLTPGNYFFPAKALKHYSNHHGYMRYCVVNRTVDIMQLHVFGIQIVSRFTWIYTFYFGPSNYYIPGTNIKAQKIFCTSTNL